MTKQETHKIDELDGKIDMILRGIYGDPENSVKGLLQRQAEDEEFHEKLKPVLDVVDEIPPMVRFYKLTTSPKLWATIAAIIGGIIGWVGLNIDKIKTFLWG